MPAAYLTKSRYLAGLQCSRRLWLNVHEPAEWKEPEAGSPEDIGRELGQMARLLFPDGILVSEEPWKHAKAMARTNALMANPSVPAIFEAAFEHGGIRIRVDILERLSQGNWGLCEVKSSGEVKDYHYDDIAVQVFVLCHLSVHLAAIEIIHVDKDYVRGLGEICWPSFFRRVDVRTEVESRLEGIEARLAEQKTCLALSQRPEIEPDGHCHQPVTCEHWEGCTASKPDDWVFHMPNLSSKSCAELQALGIESIAMIPDDFSLTPRQAIIRNVVRTGRPYVASDLPECLRGFGPPAFYFDLESFMPAVPLYPGTRPYQVIPFQWSLHELDASGKISHQGFLASADSDPRRSFAETLIAALSESDLPIIVYSSYEETRLKELAEAFPDLASSIHGIIDRLVDLLPVVRGTTYYPNFNFSFSIKAAAPALCPDITYDDLDEIADGGAASTAFWLMASGRTDAKAPAHLRRSLQRYCHRDTWAMVRLHHALYALAASSK